MVRKRSAVHLYYIMFVFMYPVTVTLQIPKHRRQYLFLAHLARSAIVSCCHTNASVARRASTLENKYSNIFFYKTTRPTVLKFYMAYGLTPGSQNCKIGSGRISKMAAVTKNSENNKINFFYRTTGYFLLNFGMKYH